MSGSFNRWALSAAVASALLVAACVTVGPTVTVPPSSATLAPGATATPAVITATLQPGQTLLMTQAPPVTDPPTTVTEPPTVTDPPTVTPPPVETPTAEATLPPEHPDWPAGAIEGKEAGEHIGENQWVCGNVASTNWVYAEPGHPTWLNFGQPYPNERFNALIWGEQRRLWPLNGKPEVVYLNKIVCVYGLIELYKTWPQIQDLLKADILVIP